MDGWVGGRVEGWVLFKLLIPMLNAHPYAIAPSNTINAQSTNSLTHSLTHSLIYSCTYIRGVAGICPSNFPIPNPPNILSLTINTQSTHNQHHTHSFFYSCTYIRGIAGICSSNFPIPYPRPASSLTLSLSLGYPQSTHSLTHLFMYIHQECCGYMHQENVWTVTSPPPPTRSSFASLICAPGCPPHRS